MNINIVDAIILLIILLGGIVGFKEGAIKKLTSIIGLVLVVVLSFVLKNYLSVIFYENLPFFDFWGIFKGLQVLNVVLYEMLAFIIIASVLMIVYKVLLGLTGLVEKILKATVILSIPSKIVGFFVGIFEYYIWIYIALFILTLPVFNIKEIYTSKVATFIITKTPVLSKYTEKTVEIYSELYQIIDTAGDKKSEKLNEDAMEVMLKYEVITPESAHKLVDKNKVNVEDDSFIDKYQ